MSNGNVVDLIHNGFTDQPHALFRGEPFSLSYNSLPSLTLISGLFLSFIVQLVPIVYNSHPLPKAVVAMWLLFSMST